MFLDSQKRRRDVNRPTLSYIKFKWKSFQIVLSKVIDYKTVLCNLKNSAHDLQNVRNCQTFLKLIRHILQLFLAACVAVCAAAPKPKAEISVAVPVATYPSYPAIPAYRGEASPAYPVGPSVGVAAVPPAISSQHSAVVHSALPTAYSAYPVVSAYPAFPATYPALKTFNTGYTHFWDWQYATQLNWPDFN